MSRDSTRPEARTSRYGDMASVIRSFVMAKIAFNTR